MIETEITPVSNVLILDNDTGSFESIREFCQTNHLIGFRTLHDCALSVLKSKIDLGAILMSEQFAGKDGGGISLAREIQRIRPELPIFLRRENTTTLDDLPIGDSRLFGAAYSLDDMSNLRKAVHDRIFSLQYPNTLLRGIMELTRIVLEDQFKNMSVHAAPPCLVHDRLIFGEIYTLIPVESHWCRGYMMLQVEESPLMQLVQSDRTRAQIERDGGFRHLNNLLGEITNLIWGSFKNRYVSYQEQRTNYTQVPIIVNHAERYITFGSEQPQLCFKYSLSDKEASGSPALTIFQRFIFNLNWAPDAFSENETSVEALIDSGEIEFF